MGVLRPDMDWGAMVSRGELSGVLLVATVEKGVQETNDQRVILRKLENENCKSIERPEPILV